MADEENHSRKSGIKRRKKRSLRPGFWVALFGVLAIAGALIYVWVRDRGTSGSVAAYVNGEPIYFSEIEGIKQMLGPQSGMFGDEEILEQLINKLLLIQAAKKAGIEVGNEELQRLISSYINQSGLTREQFEQLLASQNISKSQFEADMRDNVLITKFINQSLGSKIKVTESEMKQFYANNLELFTQPAAVRASHILVNSSEEAERVLARLKAGEDFATLAKNLSLCPSKAQGGDLDWFSYEDMVPAFSQAAFKLEIGQLSPVVKTQFGYHIIKVTNKSDAKVIPYEQVEAQLETYLKAQRQSEGLNEIIAQLRQTAKIEIKLSPKNESNQGKLGSFTDTGKDECFQNGKPIIRMYATSTCPHCNWVKPAFERVVAEYKDRIVAYLWQLDKGDNLLTPEVETAVPETEKQLFYEFNPQRSIPTFVFGCRYSRIGNYYEGKNDLAKEEADFKQVIEALLS